MKTKTNFSKPARSKTVKRKGSSAPCRGSTSDAVKVVYAVEWKERGKWKRGVSLRESFAEAVDHAKIIGAVGTRIVEISTSERLV